MFNTLNGGVLGNVDGVNVLELGLEFSQIGDEVNGVVIQSNHSSQDTIALNVSKIPNEKLAKKISCIVFDNKIVKETNHVYVYFKWDKDSILLKN